MTTPTPDTGSTPAGQRRLLTIAEVAEWLGVTIRHVRRLVQERRIPFIKWGHLLRFDPDEVEAWIRRHHIGALAPFNN